MNDDSIFKIAMFQNILFCLKMFYKACQKKKENVSFETLDGSVTSYAVFICL